MIAEHELKHAAHNESGFDTWINLKHVPTRCWRFIPIITPKALITVRMFNGFCDYKKKNFENPIKHMLLSKMNQIKRSLGKIGETFGMQHEVLKLEKDHKEIPIDT